MLPAPLSADHDGSRLNGSQNRNVVKGQGTVRRFTVDLGVGNIQNTGDSQQAAFHLTDTNHKGFILVCPTLGQFQEVTVDCFRDIA